MSLQTVLIIIGCIVIGLVYVATRVATRKSIDKNKVHLSSKLLKIKRFLVTLMKIALLNEGHIQSQLDLELSEDPQLGLFESADGAPQYLSESEELIDKDEVIETLPLDDSEILKVFLNLGRRNFPRHGHSAIAESCWYDIWGDGHIS